MTVFREKFFQNLTLNNLIDLKMDNLELYEIWNDLYESKVFCNLITFKMINCIFPDEVSDPDFKHLNQRNLKLENLEL